MKAEIAVTSLEAVLEKKVQTKVSFMKSLDVKQIMTFSTNLISAPVTKISSDLTDISIKLFKRFKLT